MAKLTDGTLKEVKKVRRQMGRNKQKALEDGFLAEASERKE